MSGGDPRATLVGAPSDAAAYVAMDPSTGELFAVVTLAEWEALAADAREFDPCAPTDHGGHMTNCNAPGCELARRVLAINTEVVR